MFVLNSFSSGIFSLESGIDVDWSIDKSLIKKTIIIGLESFDYDVPGEGNCKTRCEHEIGYKVFITDDHVKFFIVWT